MGEWIRVSETVEKRIKDLEREAGHWLVNCARTDDAFSELASAAETWRDDWYTHRRKTERFTHVDEENLARAVDNLRERTAQIRGELRSELQTVREMNEVLRQYLIEYRSMHDDSINGGDPCDCDLCKRSEDAIWGDYGKS